MKRICILILAIVLMLTFSGCCLSHEWMAASCTAPKTCTKCEKTEGEALSHEWQEATCTAPRTCSRCNATEGEALGHICSEWEATSDSTMNATCTVCKEVVEQEMDRELLGTQAILGKWYMVAGKNDDGEWARMADETWIEFEENGVFKFRDLRTENGTYEFDEYNKEYRVYWFACKTENGTFGIRYDEDDGELYWVTSTSMFYLERE